MVFHIKFLDGSSLIRNYHLRVDWASEKNMSDYSTRMHVLYFILIFHMQLYFFVALRMLYFLKKIELFCHCLHWTASSKDAGWLPEIFSHLHHNHFVIIIIITPFPNMFKSLSAWVSHTNTATTQHLSSIDPWTLFLHVVM